MMKESVRNVSKKLAEKTRNMRLNSINLRKTSLQTWDFVKKYWTFALSKKFIFVCVCIIMSSEAKRLTKERKTTAEIYVENKTHAICKYRRFTDWYSVMWVKMIDVQKKLGYKNLGQVEMKKI